MRITRVYTRTGDRGQTRLVGGTSAPKDHPRIQAYGTVDELNTAVGLARTHHELADVSDADRETLEAMLRRVQNDLFDLGSDLATPPASRWPDMHRMGDAEVTRLEGWIDELNADLPPLKEFILPGGGLVSAHLHQARTICRRAERLVVGLLRDDPEVGEGALRYLNRLSDWCFVAGRWAARSAGAKEYLWERQQT